jgi:hypothetical protein
LENTSGSASNETTLSTFSAQYEVRPIVSHRYYVAPRNQTDPLLVLCREIQKGGVNTSFPGDCRGSGVASLDRTDLVQGIEYFRLLYGEDTDGDGVANQYSDRSAVTNWNSVVAVQMGLLIRSISNYRPDTNPNREFGSAGAGDVNTKTYPILDKTGNDAVDPADLRVARRVITETIQIRNAVMNSPSA